MGRILFYHWAKAKYLNEDNPNGDFVMDMVCDRKFPWYHCFTRKSLNDYRETVIYHLNAMNACDDAISVFGALFDEYLNDLEHTYESRKEYYKEWRRKNPDKVAKYNRSYWERKILKEGSSNGKLQHQNN